MVALDLFRRVNHSGAKHFKLGLKLSFLTFRQRMIGTFRAGYQDVGRRIPARVASRNIGAIVGDLGEVSIMGFNCKLPVVQRKFYFGPGQGSTQAAATRTAKLICDCDVRIFQKDTFSQLHISNPQPGQGSTCCPAWAIVTL
jgi:hypothetical protein